MHVKYCKSENINYIEYLIYPSLSYTNTKFIERVNRGTGKLGNILFYLELTSKETEGWG